MLIAAILTIASIYATGHWVAGLATAVLFLIWHVLKPDEGPPVLALAMSYQWAQTCIGIFFTPLTGIMLAPYVDANWLPMVLVSLGCITAMTLGLRLGITFMKGRMTIQPNRPEEAMPMKTLLILYVASIVGSGSLQQLSWDYPGLASGILSFSYIHLGLLYLLLRRLARPTLDLKLIGAVMAFEVGLGFTGYFAGFREPLLMAFIMLLEIFDRRNARHWAMVASILTVLVASSMLWMSVRDTYRKDFESELTESTRAERFERIRTLSTGFTEQEADGFLDTTKALVDRLWAVYYPSFALDRVPSVYPHTNGQILEAALIHLVTPRLLFPNKADLPSDSEMVRRYAGIQVAGQETGTSIAFGYVAESYIDFGIPWMFIPSLVFGFVVGMSYKWLLDGLVHRELAVSVVTVVFWLTLYLFERSWVRILGPYVTLLVYLGGVFFIFDRFLLRKAAADDEAAQFIRATR